MNAWLISSLVCTLISLLLLLIALGSEYWEAAGQNHLGIWRACLSVPSIGIVCGDMGVDVPGYLHATRAFFILGTLTGIASACLLCVLFFRSGIASHSINKSATALNYTTGVFVLLAMAIFTGSEGANSTYSWSFGLGWACGPLFLIAGGLTHKLQIETRATA